MLRDIDSLKQLACDMMADFCRKVMLVRSKAVILPTIQKCLNYISVHLHEPPGLDDLPAGCFPGRSARYPSECVSAYVVLGNISIT